MPLLTKSKHEQFAQAIASGQLASQAYQVIYGPAKGAEQSASRLMKHPGISARIGELQGELSSAAIAQSKLSRERRLEALELRRDSLIQVIHARAAEGQALLDLVRMADPATGVIEDARFAAWRDAHLVLSLNVRNTKPGIAAVAEMIAPGGTTGWVMRDYRGKNADRVIFKEDLALAAELRKIEEQIARERGERNPDEYGAGGGGLQIPLQINVNFVSVANG